MSKKQNYLTDNIYATNNNMTGTEIYSDAQFDSQEEEIVRHSSHYVEGDIYPESDCLTGTEVYDTTCYGNTDDILINGQVVMPTPTMYVGDIEGTILGIIANPMNPTCRLDFTTYPTLEFNLPIMIQDENFEMVNNYDIELIKGRKYILFNDEWYKIDKTDESYGASNLIHVTAEGVGVELASKKVTAFTTPTATTAIDCLNIVLSGTGWTVGNVEVPTKYRYFNETSPVSVTDAITKIAEAFDCAVIYNNKDRKVDLIINEGTDSTIILHTDYNIKELNRTIEDQRIITKLYCYGNNNTSFYKFNITGQNYLLNFSYFMNNPNENGVPQDVKDAYHNYQNAIITKQGIFEGYLNSLSTKETELTTLNNALNTEKNNLQMIDNNINALLVDTIANKTQIDTLTLQRNTQQVVVNNAQNTCNTKQAEIDAINNQIVVLRDSIKMSNFFTYRQLQVLIRLTTEDVYTNNDYTDMKTFFDDCVAYHAKISVPKTTYTCKISDLMRLMNPDGTTVLPDLQLGQRITVINSDINDLAITARVTGMTRTYDANEIEIEITNIKEIDKISKLLKNNDNISAALSFGQFKMEQGANGYSLISEVLNNAWDTNKQIITGSVNEEVVISNNGINVYARNDHSKYIRIVSGAVGITQDNGNTWLNALSYKGLNASSITTGTMNCGLANIISNDQVLQIVNSKMSILDYNNHNYSRMDVGRLDTNNYGMVVRDAYLNELLRVDSNGLSIKLGAGAGGVNLNGTDGLIVTNRQVTGRVVLNADNLKFQASNNGGASWSDRLWLDSAGVIHAQELQLTTASSSTTCILNSTDGFKIRRNADSKDMFYANTTGDLYLDGTLFVRDIKDPISGDSWTTKTDNNTQKIIPDRLKLKGIQVIDSNNKITFQITENGDLVLACNGVTLDRTNGLVITRSDNKARLVAKADFIGLQANQSGTWDNKLWMTGEGELVASKLRTSSDTNNYVVLEQQTINIYDQNLKKMVLGYDFFGGVACPIIRLGAGNGGNDPINAGYIYKTEDNLNFIYALPSGKSSGIYLMKDGGMSLVAENTCNISCPNLELFSTGDIVIDSSGTINMKMQTIDFSGSTITGLTGVPAVFS